MIEYTLEEDLPEEFRGGKLSLNTNESKSSDNPVSTTKATDSKDTVKTNTDCYWGSAFISPLASLPNKITETLWSKKSEPVTHTTPGNSSTNEDTKKNTIQPSIHIIEDPHNFFTFRENIVDKAVTECCEQFLDPEADGPLIAFFLLTQINHWDTDKERLVLLTPKTLVTAKYDFIALRRLGYKKLPLEMIDQIIMGNLVYPQGSLIPQINGLADGVSHVMENCIFSHWSKNDNRRQSKFYQPRDRNMRGLRLIWNKGKPLHFGKKWNPFNEDVPFCTYTFHPLYFHKDWTEEKQRNVYNVELFSDTICNAVSALPRNRQGPDCCSIVEQNIILYNYIGVGSLIHNRNALGFFKVRGRFSF